MNLTREQEEARQQIRIAVYSLETALRAATRARLGTSITIDSLSLSLSVRFLDCTYKEFDKVSLIFAGSPPA
jgi:hypothetical protein